MSFVCVSDLHSANHIEKFKKYEADYSRWLTAKYFSKKNLYGGVQHFFIKKKSMMRNTF